MLADDAGHDDQVEVSLIGRAVKEGIVKPSITPKQHPEALVRMDCL